MSADSRIKNLICEIEAAIVEWAKNLVVYLAHNWREIYIDTSKNFSEAAIGRFEPRSGVERCRRTGDRSNAVARSYHFPATLNSSSSSGVRIARRSTRRPQRPGSESRRPLVLRRPPRGDAMTLGRDHRSPGRERSAWVATDGNGSKPAPMVNQSGPAAPTGAAVRCHTRISGPDHVEPLRWRSLRCESVDDEGTRFVRRGDREAASLLGTGGWSQTSDSRGSVVWCPRLSEYSLARSNG
jgi:hypothetical protein